jgi:hypothetical protein
VTTGPRNRPVNSARPRGLLRATPSAAAVPQTTEISVVSAATLRLASSVSRHDASLKNAPHQRNDHVSGGSRMKLCALNAAGTMAMIGSTRNATTNATKTLSAIRPFTYELSRDC